MVMDREPHMAECESGQTADTLADMRQRVQGANINEISLLATDYLNRFNEFVMVLGIIPDMPECLDDVREWRPKSYVQHFADSGLPEADLAIAAYELSPEVFRLPLDKTVDDLNRLVPSSLERIASSIESGNQDGLADVASRASRDMQCLIEAASAIINGVTSTNDQTAIDNMFEC